jgi:hypothetical protein
MNISLVSSLLSISIGIGFSQILNDDRKIDWQAGILGGIPSEQVIDINLVLDYNASNDSSSDASVDLQDAINSLTNGGVILIPEGKYRLDNQIELKYDNIIIVGEGASKTKLYSNYAGSSFFIGTYQRGNWQNLISG